VQGISWKGLRGGVIRGVVMEELGFRMRRRGAFLSLISSSSSCADFGQRRAHDSRGYGSASTTSPYSWQRRPDGSVDHSTGTHGGMAASDDVEEETMGMEAAFGSSHLVPRQQLRVTNPED
jgi:hypothetical protein